MTDQEVLQNLKNLCDGALKAGIISRIEDASALHEMFVIIENKFSKSEGKNGTYPSNHQQPQQIKLYQETRGGFEPADLP